MGIFGALKKALGDISAEATKAYSQDNRFLDAVAAGAALVANADGVIEDAERQAAVKVVRDHKLLGSLYSSDAREKAIEHALNQSKTSSGKMELKRAILDSKNLPTGQQAAEDVYMVCMDIAAADGSIGEEEKAVMTKIAGWLTIDTSKFDI